MNELVLNCPIITNQGKPYIPHKAQAAFHASDKKYRFFLAGLGAGKSSTCAYETVYHALAYPGSRNLVARRAIGNLKDTSWKTLKEILYLMDPRIIAGDPIESNNRLHLTLANGSEIIGYGLLNAMNFGSLELSTAWIDEVTEDDSEEAFKMVAGRPGRHPIGPPGGRIWCSGTANGKDWVWEMAVHNPAYNVDFFTCTTWDNLENLPEGYVEDQVSLWGRERAEAMLKCSFDVVEGKVFPDFYEGTHVIDKRRWPDIPKEWPRYAALDPGIALNHPAAFITAAIDHDGNIWIDDCFCEPNLVVQRQADKILSYPYYEELKWIMVDPSSRNRNDVTGDSRMEEYRKAGLHKVRSADNNLDNGLLKLHSLFYEDPEHTHPLNGRPSAPRIYIKSSLTDLIEQLKNYRYQKTTAAKAKTARPIPRDNDLIDALRYLVMGNYRAATEEVKPVSAFWKQLLGLGKSDRRAKTYPL